MRTDGRRYFDALTTDGVERSEANGPPTAFRIWKQGSNVTDHGPTIFSERSASKLLEEQARRGNRFSIDVDHMSLDKSAPLENHQAVGWFSLDVRAGELWATDIEWVNDTIRAGLTKGAWKYMSPAYDVDDDGEVTSFLNLSLTANPATHATTALASREAQTQRKTRMTAKAEAMQWGDIKAALDGDDEDKKASAYAAIKAAFPDKEPDGDEGEKKKEGDDSEKKDSKASEDEPEKRDAEDEPEKKDSTVAAALAEVNRLSAKVRDLEKKNETDERKSLLASRPDFAPELVTILAKAPIALVREHVAKLPKTAAVTRSTETIQATRSGDAGAASRLAPAASQALAERMGLRKSAAAIGWDPNMKTTRVFPVGAVAAKKESV